MDAINDAIAALTAVFDSGVIQVPEDETLIKRTIGLLDEVQEDLADGTISMVS